MTMNYTDPLTNAAIGALKSQPQAQGNRLQPYNHSLNSLMGNVPTNLRNRINLSQLFQLNQDRSRLPGHSINTNKTGYTGYTPYQRGPNPGSSTASGTSKLLTNPKVPITVDTVYK